MEVSLHIQTADPVIGLYGLCGEIVKDTGLDPLIAAGRNVVSDTPPPSKDSAVSHEQPVTNVSEYP